MFDRLPHRINLVWILMLIPLAAVAVVAITVIYRLPTFTEHFISAWDVQRDSDAVGTSLAEARNHHLLLVDRSPETRIAAFMDRIGNAKMLLDRLAAAPAMDEVEAKTTATQLAIERYADAVGAIDRALTRLEEPTLKGQIDRLRSDSQLVLDPVFIELTNEIVDMVRVFGCGSHLESSRQFRRDIDVLQQRLGSSALNVEQKIAMQSNINGIRGEYANLLLSCQDFDRAAKAGSDAFQDASTAYAELNAAINQASLRRLKQIIDRESARLLTLAVCAMIVFVVGFALTLRFSNGFGRQLEALTDAIRRIASGERSVSVPFLSSRDEFGDIAKHVERFRLNEIRLEDALISARQANDAKSQFLAAVSHELRTPLNAILGFAEVIRDGLFGAVSPKYRDYARDIHMSGQALLDQISQILDLSKIELGRVEADPVATDLTAVCRVAVRRLERRMHDRGIALEWSPRVADAALVDRGHIVQIVTNILDNAVKYNRNGGRVIIATRIQSDRIVLAVTDTGIGMHQHEIARAHEPFVQFGGSKDSLQGVGLGLSIVARLVAANRGTLDIASRKDHGTTVEISFPIAAAESIRSVA